MNVKTVGTPQGMMLNDGTTHYIRRIATGDGVNLRVVAIQTQSTSGRDGDILRDYGWTTIWSDPVEKAGRTT